MLYSNQSTIHCLHQQPEDYSRRHLSQYSLLRLKSYFSASTGYSVPKATICTSAADVSVTPSSGSPWAFRGHAVSVWEWTQQPIEPKHWGQMGGQNWEVICADVNKAPFTHTVNMQRNMKMNGRKMNVLDDPCLADKNECVLCNVMPLQWTLFHTKTWIGCDVDSCYWQDGRARAEPPVMWRSLPHAQSPQ